MSDIEHIEEHTEDSIETTEQSDSKSVFGSFVAQFEDTFAEFKNTFETFKKEEEEIMKLIKEHSQKRKQFNKEVSKIIKVVNTFSSKLEGVHQKDKPKRKRTENSGKSGVNKKQPVPPELVKYLELNDGDEYSRPEISKLLSLKFETDGFKKKEDRLTFITIKSSKAAKKLGVEKGYKFPAKAYQTFLKPYYDRLKNSSNDDSDEDKDEDEDEDENEDENENNIALA